MQRQSHSFGANLHGIAGVPGKDESTEERKRKAISSPQLVQIVEALSALGYEVVAASLSAQPDHRPPLWTIKMHEGA